MHSSLDRFRGVPRLPQTPSGESPLPNIVNKRLALLLASFYLQGCPSGIADPDALEDQVEDFDEQFRCGLATDDMTTLPMNFLLGEGDHGVTVVDFSHLDEGAASTLKINSSGTWSVEFFGPREIGELNFEFSVDHNQVRSQTDETGESLEIPVKETITLDGEEIEVEATVTLDFYEETWIRMASPLAIGDLDLQLHDPPPPDPLGLIKRANPTGPLTPRERCERLFDARD